jgi:hypothetical protein
MSGHALKSGLLASTIFAAIHASVQPVNGNETAKQDWQCYGPQGKHVCREPPSSLRHSRQGPANCRTARTIRADEKVRLPLRGKAPEFLI